MGNYKKAFHYQAVYQQYKDSTFSIERNNKINTLIAKYEAKEKESKIRNLENEAKISRYIILTISLVSFLLILIAVFIFRTIRNKNKLLKLAHEKETLEKEKLTLKLDKKNREILTHTIQISNQKEIFSNINDKLNSILEHKNAGELKKSIRELTNELKSNIELNNDWNEIKMHFEKVHPTFFNNLQQRHPKLTLNDLKLCAYVKLRFNKKDVGRILNITPGSVHIARYRLKKKMEVPEGVDFDAFILDNY